MLHLIDNIGITNTLGALERDRVIVSNRIGAITFCMAIPYFFIFSYFNLSVATFGVVASCIYAFAILGFNYFKKYSLSRINAIFGMSAILLFYTITLGGTKSGAYLLYFPMAMWPFILFREDQKLLKSIAVATQLILSIGIQVLVIIHFPYFKTSISDVSNQVIHIFATVTTFLFITLTTFVFYKSEQKAKRQLSKKIKELEFANSEIKIRMKDEVEIKLGKELQKKYLTKIKPSYDGFPNVIFDTFYQGARVVSGDYYTAKITKNNIFRYALVDITGKGVQSALTMVHVHTIVYEFIHEKEALSSSDLFSINNKLLDMPINKTGCDIFLCDLNLETGQLTYVNAGLETAYILSSNGDIELLNSTGLKAGLEKNETYDLVEKRLNSGDMLFLSTDGIIDMRKKSFGKKGEIYGFSRLEKCLKRFLAQKTGKSLKHVILSEMKLYHGNLVLEDDTTFLCVNFKS